MGSPRTYIAVDLGAESGRVMLSTVSDEKLTLEEIHRFGNGPVEVEGPLRWDFAKLFGNIKDGIGRAVKQAGPVSGIAVNSWGVDYGLLGADGQLLEMPYHYRDGRTDGMEEEAFKIMGRRRIYDLTGIQFMQLNTIYQLFSMKLSGDEALAKTKHLVMMADLVSYFLCGEIFCEYSLASTSQLLNMQTGKWELEIFDKLGLPVEIMPRVVPAGTIVGKLTAEIAAELGCEQIPVIAAGSHDTADAVAAVPADKSSNWAYLSSGTWSLIGVESPTPAINDTTYDFQFTNEGGVCGTIRLLKNIMGLWIVQECRRQWQRDGLELSYGAITEMAQAAQPFAAFIDPNAGDFFAPGDMPNRVNTYLKQNGQPVFEDKGQLVRVVLEGLALRYRWALEKLEQATGRKIEVLHVVGGGIQNELLCQLTANATGRKVIAGPIEATATGNVLMQAIATGQIGSLAEGRKLVERSYCLREYTPQDQREWQHAYEQAKLG